MSDLLPEPDEMTVETLTARLVEADRENAMLKAAIRASPTGILIASAPDGVIEMWNSAALELGGVEAPKTTHISPEQSAAHWKIFDANGVPYKLEELPLSRALMAGETVEGDDAIIRRPDGTERWVTGHAAPVRDRGGSIVGGVVVFSDITERRNADAAMERFRMMAEASPDFVGMAAITGESIYLNAAGLKMLGYPADQDLHSLDVTDFHPEGYRNEIREIAIPTAVKDGYWQGETELLMRDGDSFPVSQALMAHRGADGQPLYFSTVIRDIRPQREMEAQLRQSQRLESIGRFAGGVAHDFNNLLTVILNYAVLVESTFDEEDERREDLEQVQIAGKRAADLCDRLLSVARRQIINPTTIDLGEVVEELSILFRRTLGEDILLETDVGEDLWPVKVDRSQLSQVLLNLVVNARDAMPEGGELTIEAHNIVLDETYCEGHRTVSPGEYVVIAVSDTGVGMDPAVQERVFEPFFTTRSGQGGNGLGLATVHGAVRQNNGHIWLYSEPGKGTCFKIYWPRSEASVNEAATSPQSTETHGSGTVLVVEDEDILRALTVRLLKEGGYDVLEASDGAQALSVAKEYFGTIDLLVTDVIMPGMNGRVLADSLLEARPGLNVLFVSGYTENTIVHRGVLDADVDFLAKPFSREALLTRVTALSTKK